MPLVMLVPTAMLIYIGIIFYTFTYPPLLIVLRRVEMQGLPFVRPPLLRGDARAPTQLVGASMAWRTGRPLDLRRRQRHGGGA
jgi:hypothetical protein